MVFLTTETLILAHISDIVSLSLVTVNSVAKLSQNHLRKERPPDKVTVWLDSHV